MPDLDCLAPPGAAARPVHVVRPAGLEALLARLPPAQAGFLRATGFTAASGAVALLPELSGEGGVAGAVLGLGAERGPFPFGALPFGLPPGDWALAPGGDADASEAVLGFCLGAHRQDPRRPLPGEPARRAGRRLRRVGRRAGRSGGPDGRPGGPEPTGPPSRTTRGPARPPPPPAASPPAWCRPRGWSGRCRRRGRPAWCATW